MLSYIDSMNSAQRKALSAIFAEPVAPNIHWAAVEGLLVALGCRGIEGAGSRVTFERDGLIASCHRPHPAKQAKRYQVRDARAFLLKLGVKP